MQQIQPIQYVPTSPLIATQINVWTVFDNLENMANFNWQLLTINGELVDWGTVTLSDQEYIGWNGNRQYPYSYTSQTIGVTLL
jgi:hypothetical protein